MDDERCGTGLNTVREIDLPIEGEFVLPRLGDGFKDDPIVNAGEAIAFRGEHTERSFPNQHLLHRRVRADGAIGRDHRAQRDTDLEFVREDRGLERVRREGHGSQLKECRCSVRSGGRQRGEFVRRARGGRIEPDRHAIHGCRDASREEGGDEFGSGTQDGVGPMPLENRGPSGSAQTHADPAFNGAELSDHEGEGEVRGER